MHQSSQHLLALPGTANTVALPVSPDVVDFMMGRDVGENR